MSALQRLQHLSRHVARQSTSAQRAMSTQTPKSASESVLFEKDTENFHVLTLNREKKFNALNLDMVKAIRGLYGDLRSQGAQTVVWMQGAGPKAFCAGGDVASIVEPLKERNTQPGVDGVLR